MGGSFGRGTQMVNGGVAVGRPLGELGHGTAVSGNPCAKGQRWERRLMRLRNREQRVR